MAAKVSNLVQCHKSEAHRSTVVTNFKTATAQNEAQRGCLWGQALDLLMEPTLLESVPTANKVSEVFNFNSVF